MTEQRIQRLEERYDRAKADLEEAYYLQERRWDVTLNELEVGDIFVSSWGYGQTNIDFYELVAFAGKTQVVLRPIEKKITKYARSQMGEYVRAVPGKYTGGKIRKKFQHGGVSLSSFSAAFPVEDPREEFLQTHTH